jgi:hypothetical protein
MAARDSAAVQSSESASRRLRACFVVEFFLLLEVESSRWRAKKKASSLSSLVSLSLPIPTLFSASATHSEAAWDVRFGVFGHDAGSSSDEGVARKRNAASLDASMEIFRFRF